MREVANGGSGKALTQSLGRRPNTTSAPGLAQQHQLDQGQKAHVIGWRLLPVHQRLASGAFSTVDTSLPTVHPPMPPKSPSFRGNKAALPSKPCVACGRPMAWRRRWARSWDEVRYCSDACRRARAGRG